jgi:holo-[acyl-carrier protein] synthase
MIGIDIVSIRRIEKSYERFNNKLLEKFLCDEEIKLIKSTQTIAGFWAVKEAVSKALKCGIGKELAFHDIIIYKNEKNAPFVKITKKLQEKFHVKDIDISIAHDAGFAIAVAAIEKY